MAALLLSPFSLLLLARVSASIVALLVLTWAVHFQTSFIPHSPSQDDLIYAVLHPLLMVIGFILVSGEAILVHRWLPGSRNLKKSVHLCLQGVALGCGVFGIWTKFHSREGIVANFYSLHSWMGLVCISLFGAQVLEGIVGRKPMRDKVQHQVVRGIVERSLKGQVQHFPLGNWMVGFLSFWHRGEVRTTRIQVLPWHVFLGLYTYGLAVVTAETGLLEKLTFLQTNGALLKCCTETMVVNGLGLGLALLSGIVIFAAISPKHQISHSKIVYSNKKWSSS